MLGWGKDIKLIGRNVEPHCKDAHMTPRDPTQLASEDGVVFVYFTVLLIGGVVGDVVHYFN